jgi:crotonobetainyl-CoA:carnitine CoA-transferase CaiB-like acyl-CoA transferase
LDLRQPKGKEIFCKLISTADVCVENFRPGVMEKLGLGYDTLIEHNQTLVYASASGFGRHSEHAKRPAFDSLLQAAGGLISVTGQRGKDGEGHQYCRVGVSVVDYVSGLNALIGILASLQSKQTGEHGQRVDVSMLATTVALMENHVVRHSVETHNRELSGSVEAFIPEPEGLAHPVVAPFNGYTSRDGIIYIAISNSRIYHVLLKALRGVLQVEVQEGYEEKSEEGGIGLLEGESAEERLARLVRRLHERRFETNEGRMEHANRASLEAALHTILRSRTTEEWEEVLVSAGVPASAVCDVAEVKKRFPDAFVSVSHPLIEGEQVGGVRVVLSSGVRVVLSSGVRVICRQG